MTAICKNLSMLCPFAWSILHSKHQALVSFAVFFSAVTCNICHAGTSRMDEVYINQEADPYVIEVDGTLDLAALQLQPATFSHQWVSLDIHSKFQTGQLVLTYSMLHCAARRAWLMRRPAKQRGHLQIFSRKCCMKLQLVAWQPLCAFLVHRLQVLNAATHATAGGHIAAAAHAVVSLMSANLPPRCTTTSRRYALSRITSCAHGVSVSSATTNRRVCCSYTAFGLIIAS